MLTAEFSNIWFLIIFLFIHVVGCFEYYLLTTDQLELQFSLFPKHLEVKFGKHVVLADLTTTLSQVFFFCIALSSLGI